MGQSLTASLPLRWAQDDTHVFHGSFHPSTCFCPSTDPTAANLHNFSLSFLVRFSTPSPSVVIPRKYSAGNLRFSNVETPAMPTNLRFFLSPPPFILPSTNFACFIVRGAREHPVPSLLQTVSRCVPSSSINMLLCAGFCFTQPSVTQQRCRCDDGAAVSF